MDGMRRTWTILAALAVLLAFAPPRGPPSSRSRAPLTRRRPRAATGLNVPSIRAALARPRHPPGAPTDRRPGRRRIAHQRPALGRQSRRPQRGGRPRPRSCAARAAVPRAVSRSRRHRSASERDAARRPRPDRTAGGFFAAATFVNRRHVDARPRADDRRARIQRRRHGQPRRARHADPRLVDRNSGERGRRRRPAASSTSAAARSRRALTPELTSRSTPRNARGRLPARGATPAVDTRDASSA